MWRVEIDRAYPFRHNHANHFPPKERGIDSFGCDFRLSPCLEEDEEEEESEAEDVPIFFLPEALSRGNLEKPNIRNMSISSRPVMKGTYRGVDYPLSPPPNRNPPPPFMFQPLHYEPPRNNFQPSTPVKQSFQMKPKPPPFRFPPQLQHFNVQTIHQEDKRNSMDPPPSPASIAPAHLTNLLQDVLGIMNTIMGQQAVMEEENETLQELVELVVIMQEEAEALVELADLVEEFVDEVDAEVDVRTEVNLGEIGEWVGGLDLDGVGVSIKSPVYNEDSWDSSPGGGTNDWHHRSRRTIHEREDSGVGLDSDEGRSSMETQSIDSISIQGSLKEMDEKKLDNLRRNNEEREEQMRIEQFPPRSPAGRSPTTPSPKKVNAVTPVKSKSKRLSPLNVGKKGRPVPAFREAPFRDSALGLLSPDNLPQRTPTPKWS